MANLEVANTVTTSDTADQLSSPPVANHVAMTVNGHDGTPAVNGEHPSINGDTNSEMEVRHRVFARHWRLLSHFVSFLCIYRFTTLFRLIHRVGRSSSLCYLFKYCVFLLVHRLLGLSGLPLVLASPYLSVLRVELLCVPPRYINVFHSADSHRIYKLFCFLLLDIYKFPSGVCCCSCSLHVTADNLVP